jgi:hypothetical protein
MYSKMFELDRCAIQQTNQNLVTYATESCMVAQTVCHTSLEVQVSQARSCLCVIS